MASPQKENGFTPIANEILEALCKMNLSPYESRVLWFLLRKTYGYQRKADHIPSSQFSRGTGLDRRLVHRALKGLSSKKMTVISRDDTNRPTIGFQKDYAQWVFPTRRKAHVISRDDKVSSVEMSKLSSPEMHSKDIRKKKERVKGKPSRSFDGPAKGDGTSEFTLDEGFNRFWNSYPIRTGKGVALRAWKKLKPDCELQAKIQVAIKAQIQWREERAGVPKLFTPEWKHPTTWLNAMAWEDQVEDVGEGTNGKIPFYCNRCGTSHPEGEHTK